jgi:hypothetical protein
MSDAAALVVPRSMKPQPTLRSRDRIQWHQVKTATGREEDAEDVGEAVVGLGTPPVIGRQAVEQKATAVWPCGLALDPQERRVSQVHDEVVRVTAAERHEHPEAALDERIENGRFGRVAPATVAHAVRLRSGQDRTYVRTRDKLSCPSERP